MVGSTMSSNLTEPRLWKHGTSDGDLAMNIRQGIGPKYAMPPWGAQLSDDEILQVIAYIRSLNANNVPRE